jgi:hypothetical protein
MHSRLQNHMVHQRMSCTRWEETPGITSFLMSRLRKFHTGMHHLFTHTTNDCKELRRQIQSAIEQGRLILGQFTMKVDTRPFPGVNMVEGHSDMGKWSARRRLDFSFDVNMAGSLRCHDEEKGPVPVISPGKAKRSTSLKNR